MIKYKYNYTSKQIDAMAQKIENYKIDIEKVDLTNEYFLIKTNTHEGIISFADFEVDFDIFLQIAQPKPNVLNFGSFAFKMEDLRQAILNPVCSCGGKIECYYDGEYSEDYTFTCECGAKEVLNGYWLDSLVED